MFNPVEGQSRLKAVEFMNISDKSEGPLSPKSVDENHVPRFQGRRGKGEAGDLEPKVKLQIGRRGHYLRERSHWGQHLPLYPGLGIWEGVIFSFWSHQQRLLPRAFYLFHLLKVFEILKLLVEGVSRLMGLLKLLKEGVCCHFLHMFL